MRKKRIICNLFFNFVPSFFFIFQNNIYYISKYTLHISSDNLEQLPTFLFTSQEPSNITSNDESNDYIQKHHTDNKDTTNDDTVYQIITWDSDTDNVIQKDDTKSIV